MTTVELIEKVLRSGVLKKSLTFVPDRGATPQELTALLNTLPRALSTSHENILRRWNGLNLDVLRLYGASATDKELRDLKEVQSGPLVDTKGTIVIGDDPSGFVYAETASGEILAFDSAYGEVKSAAPSLDDFICKLIFGEDADQFAGKAWLQDLKNAGIV